MEYGGYPSSSSKKKINRSPLRGFAHLFFKVGIEKADWVAGVTTDVNQGLVGR
ncbi:MAG: hypothetical protein CM15mP84_10420 [Cellvibrionales bacterium]|nr:MAG: hypothetical protein CM15mP84_10420 [Cellvibrionales bacterium]